MCACVNGCVCAWVCACLYARVNDPPQIPILVLGGLCLIPSFHSAIGVFQEKEKVSDRGVAGGLVVLITPTLKGPRGRNSFP